MTPQDRSHQGGGEGGGGSHNDFPSVEISIAGGVGEMVCANYCDLFFYFLNHTFIVYTVQEMTCIFKDMAKTKPKIKLTINNRNKHNQIPQRDQ